MKQLRIKRVYEAPARDDGVRVLVDRLWPRGLSKEKADVEIWAKDVAPSTELRKWFGHDPAKWEEFRKRYRAELDANPEAVAEVRALLEKHANATLLFAAHDEKHANAVVLAEYLRGHAPRPRRKSRA
jgi:uncharacterized protein YeaO (DUF488 family)